MLGMPSGEELMDILLVDPPYKSLKGVVAEFAYPMSLVKLAGYLRQGGVDTGILCCDLLADVAPTPIWDFDLAGYAEGQRAYARALGPEGHRIWDAIRDAIATNRPSIVGLTCLTPSQDAGWKVAAIAKEVDPSITVIAGGHHATFCPDQTLGQDAVDYVVRGEGELPLLQLARQVTAGDVDPASVPGVSFRGEGGIVHNPPPPLIHDLDALPRPARDLVLDCDYKKYPDHLAGSSRGCPYTCAFCSDKRLWGGRVRRRSPENVVAKLKELAGAYPVKLVDFVDGTFTFDRKWMRRFCESLKGEGVNVRWRCTARYDNMEEELLGWMKEAGCVSLYFGLESGSAEVLKSVDKKTTVGQIKQASRLVKHSGIASVTSILLGLPEEDRGDMEQTLALMEELETDLFDINCYVPLPGTRYWDAMSAAEQDAIDWATVGYKSFDNNFNSNVPQHELQEILRRAYAIAGDAMRLFRERLA